MVAENLLFGTRWQGTSTATTSPLTLHAVGPEGDGLDLELQRMGLTIARPWSSCFSGLSPDNPLFEQVQLHLGRRVPMSAAAETPGRQGHRCGAEPTGRA